MPRQSTPPRRPNVAPRKRTYAHSHSFNVVLNFSNRFFNRKIKKNVPPLQKPDSLRNYARGVGRTRRPLTDVIPVVNTQPAEFLFSFGLDQGRKRKRRT